VFDLAGSWRVLGQVAAAIQRSKDQHLTKTPALPQDPAACFAESLRLYDNIGAKDEMARTLLLWADFEQQQGRTEQSREKTDRAHGILAGLTRS
jgi:hypothetical protein